MDKTNGRLCAHRAGGGPGASGYLAQQRRRTLAHYNVTTTEGRIAYLRALGWDADPATETAQEIVLPRTFDGVFGDYNALQKQQGFDLSIYAGETCSVYTYRVMNYAGTSGTVLAQLFVYRNRVIGGDIHATAMDGFMHGLR